MLVRMNAYGSLPLVRMARAGEGEGLGMGGPELTAAPQYLLQREPVLSLQLSCTYVRPMNDHRLGWKSRNPYPPALPPLPHKHRHNGKGAHCLPRGMRHSRVRRLPGARSLFSMLAV